MIEKLFALALALGTLNNAKPRIENTNKYVDGNPRILKATDEEAKDIMLNSYWYAMGEEDWPTTISDIDTTYNITITLYHTTPSPQKFLHNQIYFMMRGYPNKYTGYVEDDMADYLVNPYGLYTNDGEYYHLILNQEDWSNPTRDGASLVCCNWDIPSGFRSYGFFIPKNLIDTETYQRAIVSIAGKNIELYSLATSTEENPNGLNYEYKEPAYINYDSYAPMRNKTQNTNYLKGERGTYQSINDNRNDSTADDNMYYYDAIFDDNLFVNRALGVGNYAVNSMYLIYPSGPDYKYDNLSMYNIAPQDINYSDYWQQLNEYYNSIGGYNQIYKTNNEHLLNRITNAENDQNGNYWRWDSASEFIILNPKKTYNGVSQMQILESHMISGVSIDGPNIGITIDAGIGDVFTLLATAFTGFGGFFAIAILPGITLGTLFLMPFITTLVIWLIHLFKRH